MNVFVSGGSRGIGRAIALRFARDGAKSVAIGYLRNDDAAEQTAKDIASAYGAEMRSMVAPRKPKWPKMNSAASRILASMLAPSTRGAANAVEL